MKVYVYVDDLLPTILEPRLAAILVRGVDLERCCVDCYCCAACSPPATQMTKKDQRVMCSI